MSTASLLFYHKPIWKHNMKEKNIDRHNQCQCEIRYRQFKGKDELTPGLFCSNHDVFLDWLNRDIAKELIDSGISTAPYIDRKEAKKIKPAKSKFYRKAKRIKIRAKAKLA
jgi:hypothetical protein